jgi:hypothetical protein
VGLPNIHFESKCIGSATFAADPAIGLSPRPDDCNGQSTPWFDPPDDSQDVDPSVLNAAVPHTRLKCSQEQRNWRQKAYCPFAVELWPSQQFGCVTGHRIPHGQASRHEAFVCLRDPSPSDAADQRKQRDRKKPNSINKNVERIS